MSKFEKEIQEQIDSAISKGDVIALDALLATLYEKTAFTDAPFSPSIRLKSQYAQRLRDDGAESDAAMNWANNISRAKRYIQFQSRMANGFSGLRIVSEGDSWFQYPLLLNDVVDQLSIDDDKAILSLGAAGDTLEAMTNRAEYFDAISNIKADVYIFSAGGNDLLGGGNLASYLKNYSPGARPKDLIKRKLLKRKFDHLFSAYEEMISEIVSLHPQIKILSHGYDVPHPKNGGKWIGSSLAKKNIPLNIGREIVRLILVEFNYRLAELEWGFSQYTHVDLMGKIGGDWHDELHPSDDGFRNAADRFRRKIEQAFETEERKVIEKRKAHWSMTTEDERHNREAEQAHENMTMEQLSRQFDDLMQKTEQSPETNSAEAVRVATQKILSKRTTCRQKNVQSSNGQFPEETKKSIKDVFALLSELDRGEGSDLWETRQNIIPADDDHAIERILGDSNLYPVNFLEKGFNAARAVGRIDIGNSFGGIAGYGTGFLVGDGLLMTNNHVLESGEIAENSRVLFDYEMNIDGRHRPFQSYRITSDVFFTSKAHDVSFVSVEPISQRGVPLESFGKIPLIENSGKGLKGEKVTIVQHPKGSHKKIALRDSQVLGRKRHYVYYTTDTDPGSSGSPVFNDHWHVVALHHRTVPHPEKPNEFIANQGVRISSIFEHLEAKRRANDSMASKVLNLLFETMQAESANSETEDTVSSNDGNSIDPALIERWADPDRAEALAADLDADEPTAWATNEESESESLSSVEANGKLSEEGIDHIIRMETGGRSYYENVYKGRPVWPGASSGVTVGVGYDIGYNTKTTFKRDWETNIPSSDLNQLAQTAGIRGPSARSLAKNLRHIRISWDAAIAVFMKTSLPKFVKITYRHLPADKLDALHPHCRSALVSLVFNRGTTFRKNGQRYREMRNILALLNNDRFSEIPGQLRSMKRIWINTNASGVVRHREAEAKLFESGLRMMESETTEHSNLASSGSIKSDTNGAANPYANGSHHSHMSDNDDEEMEAFTLAHAEPWAEQATSLTSLGSPNAFERSGRRLSSADVGWVSNSKNNPDYWHVPDAYTNKTFKLTADVISELVRLGHYKPVTAGHGKLVIALRGAILADGSRSVTDRSSIDLRSVNPDHKKFRCLLGVLDTASKRISLYQGSTVPNTWAVAQHYNWRNGHRSKLLANILPTGCYEYCHGTHYGSQQVEGVLRLGNTPNPPSSSVTVLRSSNDAVYGTQDDWDYCRPADNIHPAFGKNSFSSLGCLTVRGTHNNGHHSGEWADFRKAVGLDQTQQGTRYDLLLTTGAEAAAISSLMDDNSALNSLRRISHGSQGEFVGKLQKQLNVSVDNFFGGKSKAALCRVQRTNLIGNIATGIYVPQMDELLNFDVFQEINEAIFVAASPDMTDHYQLQS